MHSKKKGAASTTSSKSSKVQVRLLKQLPGTGQKGDVVLVTSAFFQNKLLPGKLAEIISDEEVAAQDKRAREEADVRQAKALALQELLRVSTLTILRKAGPDGQLFGGINAKTIISEVQEQLIDNTSDADFWKQQRSMKVLDILDEQESKIQGDIKHTGTFYASVSIIPGVTARVPFVVKSQS
jgi:ribosomal protein L9